MLVDGDDDVGVLGVVGVQGDLAVEDVDALGQGGHVHMVPDQVDGPLAERDLCSSFQIQWNIKEEHGIQRSAFDKLFINRQIIKIVCSKRKWKRSNTIKQLELFSKIDVKFFRYRQSNIRD